MRIFLGRISGGFPHRDEFFGVPHPGAGFGGKILVWSPKSSFFTPNFERQTEIFISNFEPQTEIF